MKISEHTIACNSKYETSYFRIRSGIPGPTVILTAGVHGNEPAAVRAAKRLLRAFSNGTMRLARGELILLPITNRDACRKGVRGRPDLNRTFPRTGGESPKHPVSVQLYAMMKRHRPSWYIDLHEANGLSRLNRRRLGQTLITNPGSGAIPAALRTIRALNSGITDASRHFTLRLKSKEGSGRTAVSRLLKAKAITVETCWSLPFERRATYQRRIAELLLREAGIL